MTRVVCVCGGGCSAAAWCRLTQRTAACNGSALYEIWGCRFINIYVFAFFRRPQQLDEPKEEKQNTTGPVRVPRINVQIDASTTEDSYF